jgi:hypothetical protein
VFSMTTTGYPTPYARNDIPEIESYAGGQSIRTPRQIDLSPGHLLGSVSGELGLRKYLESLGHAFIVTSDKEGANSVFERELPDADVVMSQPFWLAIELRLSRGCVATISIWPLPWGELSAGRRIFPASSSAHSSPQVNAFAARTGRVFDRIIRNGYARTSDRSA